jgi:hypothetical protein
MNKPKYNIFDIPSYNQMILIGETRKILKKEGSTEDELYDFVHTASSMGYYDCRDFICEIIDELNGKYEEE